MPSNRKHVWIVLPIVILVAAGALFWWFSPWRRGLEEQGFRLLPAENQFAVHIDVAALRNNPLAGRIFAQASPNLEADYGDFVRGTGFNWEQDLDTLDLGISGPPDQRVVNAVLAGRFRREKVDTYLAPRRKSSTFHTSTNIDEFTGPSGRPLRLAFIGSGRLLFSNAPGPQAITNMVELSRRSGASLGGRMRELRVFERVPAAAQFWGSADLERGAQLSVPAPGADVSLASALLRGGRMAVASATVSGQNIDMKLEAAYADAASADRVARGLNALRQILRALADRPNAKPSQNVWEKALNQLAVAQKGQEVVVSLQLDAALVELMLAQTAPAAPPAKR